jgi:hypothetical protein
MFAMARAMQCGEDDAREINHRLIAQSGQRASVRGENVNPSSPCNGKKQKPQDFPPPNSRHSRAVA